MLHVNSRTRPIAGLIAAAILITGVTSTAWAQAPADLRAGIDAFKAGRYDVARDAFQRALAAGDRSPTLYFNLGSTLFKLGDYPAAERAFAQIVNDPTWGALANYNLGLTAERLGRGDDAQRFYQAAYDTSASEKIKRLAGAKLDIARTARTSGQSAWFGIASLGGGYDDNLVLLNDQNLVGVSNKSDYFGEAFAAASRFIRGDTQRGWRADAAGYYRGYREQHEFDYGNASVGATYSRDLRDMRWQFGARAGAEFVGRDPYTTFATQRTQVAFEVESFAIRLRNDLGWVEGADHFGYLTGWRDRIGAQIDRRISGAPVLVGYDFEVNDRRDFASASEAFSYSPNVHRVYADGTWPPTDALDVNVRVEYRWSRYAHDDVQIEADGSVAQGKRDDDRMLAVLRLTYHPVPQWNFYTEYSYANNSSNFATYEYTDNQIAIGIERPF